MIIDHIGAVFPMYFPPVLRVIGRISFPLYVYLIADGCRYTRSMPKYLLRLGLFALISQIPFDLAFNQQYIDSWHISFWQDTNVFYTLFLGALCIYILQKLRETGWLGASFFSVVPLAGVMILAQKMNTDYAAFGVAFIFVMYCIPQKWPRLGVMALFCCFEYYEVILGGLEQWLGFPLLRQSYAMHFNAYGIWLLGGCLLAVPLVALYNGSRGPKMKWLFYWSYPVHLSVLAFIWLFFVRPMIFG